MWMVMMMMESVELSEGPLLSFVFAQDSDITRLLYGTASWLWSGAGWCGKHCGPRLVGTATKQSAILNELKLKHYFNGFPSLHRGLVSPFFGTGSDAATPVFSNKTTRNVE